MSWKMIKKVKLCNKRYHGMVCLAVKLMAFKSKQLSGEAVKFAYYKPRTFPSILVLKILYKYDSFEHHVVVMAL